MADTVKTGILKAIETLLSGIPAIKTVFRWQEIPIDLAEFEKPVLFFWEEEDKERRNRLTLGKLDFWIQVFFALDPEDPASYAAFTEAAEEAAGYIQNEFAVNLRATGLIQALPGRVVKAKHNDDFGILFMTYQLTYGHATGDAFAATM